MKIGIDAHFVGVRHGGNEHHFGNVLRAMARLPQGDEEFFVFNYRGAGKDALPGGRFGVVELRKRSVYLQRAWEIPRAARRLGLDVIHVPFNVLPVGRAKKVLTIHDLAFLHVGDTFDYLERKRMAIMTAFSARRADHIFAVSEFSKRDIMHQYGIPENRITVTYNAVDGDEFNAWSRQERDQFRTANGLPERFLLFVGTLQPRKNVINLLRAFARLARQDKEVRLLLVGRKGWIYDSIFTFIRENDLATRVSHRENVDARTLVGLYNTAAGLVFPSIFEGFGMPILEAMRCGCPVASANVTSMPEIYGEAALEFDPRDIPGMAAQMAVLAGDEAARRELIRKGAANCGRFSWEQSASRILQVYRSV
jgi:glycosyltransferase involved in cell wall biosynthesis